MPTEPSDTVAELQGLLEASIEIARWLEEKIGERPTNQTLANIAKQQTQDHSKIDRMPLASRTSVTDKVRGEARKSSLVAHIYAMEGGWLEELQTFGWVQKSIVSRIANVLGYTWDVALVEALVRMQRRHERYWKWCSLVVPALSLAHDIVGDADDEWFLGRHEARGEIVLDLETRRLAQEVEGGWRNIPALGLAVAVTWDKEFLFRIWLEEDAHRLVDELSRFQRIVGFNIIRFDYAVLGAYCDVPASLIVKALDLLVDVEGRLGHRVGLENLATATLGRGKAGEGIAAVNWFRKGDLDKVIRYCQEDVALTRDLYYRGCQDGCLYYLDSGERRSVEVEWQAIEAPD